MPYPNEHAARIREPSRFDPESFRNKDLKNGIRIILGKLKGEDSMTVQAYRFSLDQFTFEEAKKWLEDNKVLFMKFEPASEESIFHTGVIGMKWGVRNSVSRAGGAVKAHIKTATTPSSDHLEYKSLRKKRMKNLTDEEVRTVVKRMKLVSSYKKAGEYQTKQTKAMSNAELERGINRQRLRKAIVRNPRSMKFKEFLKSYKMSNEEAKRLIKRINLENSYKDLKIDEFEPTRKLINTFIDIGMKG